MCKRTHVPDKLEGYMLQVRHALYNLISWQGTASQLLTEMEETEVTANVVTKLLARFSAEVLMPQGIEYRTKRTGTSRLIRLEMNDSDDGNDGRISI